MYIIVGIQLLGISFIYKGKWQCYAIIKFFHRSKLAESCVVVYCGAAASLGKRPVYEQAAVGETISMYKSVIATKLILY